MALSTTDILLTKSIHSLGLSQEFTVTMEILGFHTLADLSRHRSPHLLSLPGFTRELLYEYVHFMEAHGHGKLVDP